MKELLEEKKSNVRHLESVKFHIEKENVEITQKKNTGLIEKLNQLNQEEKREEKRLKSWRKSILINTSK